MISSSLRKISSHSFRCYLKRMSSLVSEVHDWTQFISTTEIIFVRHAESYNNNIVELIRQKFGDNISDEEFLREEGLLRQADCDLSDKGYLQASLLGKYVQEGGFQTRFMNGSDTDISSWAVVSSPMQRCLLTCKEVAIGLNKDVIVNPILYEAQGCYERDASGNKIGVKGASADSVESRFPRYKCMPGMEEGWFHSPTMESGQEFRQRTARIVEWLWEVHAQGAEKCILPGTPSFKHMVVVVHANLINAVLSGLLGAEGLFIHNNTGYTHVQLITAGPSHRRVAAIKSLNTVCPLFTPDLHTGGHLTDDRWIQEYVDDDDYFLPTKKTI